MADLGLVSTTDLIHEIQRRHDASLICLWTARSDTATDFCYHRVGPLHATLGLAYGAAREIESDLMQITSKSTGNGEEGA